MLKNISLIFFVISYYNSLSQGQWEWVNGSVNGGTPIFGTTGIPSVNNNPGGNRYCSTPWVDNNGMFWFWGGEDLSAGTLRSDLWMFNPNTNEWTYIGGDAVNAPTGTFNTLATPSPTTWPGGKLHGSPSWVDLNNNLWVYGTESTWANDLWKFNINTGEWAWMHGSAGVITAPTYGIQGIAAPANTPGGYIEENTDPWVDGTGNLWFFNFEDGVMWKFDTNLNQWIWVNGIPNAGAVYGTIGIESPNNSPGDGTNDWTWCTWEDSNGYFWLLRNYVQMMGAFNTEIWRFNPINEQWACMKTTPIGEVSYSLCIEHINNSPPMEMENRTAWVDDCDNLWRLDGDAFFGYGLWRYNPLTNSFMQVASYGAPNYGTQGIPSVNNNPTATQGQAWWTNEDGFWLRDGVTGSTGTSVMWLYHPDTVVADFNYTTNCLDINFTDMSYTGCNSIKSWIWDFGDGTTSTAQNPIHTYSSSGNYVVSLIVNNCTWDADTITQLINVNCGFSISLTDTIICQGDCIDLIASSNENTDSLVFIWDNGIVDSNDTINICPLNNTVYNLLAINNFGDTASASALITIIPYPEINLGNDTTVCNNSLLLNANNSGSTYTWQNGSSNQTFTVTTSGIYTVEVNNNGCISSDSINVSINGPLVDLGQDIITCNPNLILDALNPGSTYLWQDGSTNQTFIVSDTGEYYVEVTNIYGCTATDTILVNPDTITVNLGSDTTICMGSSFVLDAGNTGANYLWQDGSTSQTISTDHTVLYYVNVTNGICIGSDSINIFIQEPIALFTVSDTIGCAPLIVSYTDLSITPSPITDWYWNFGDGTTSNTQNPNHIYNASGNYNVELVITTNDGCTSNMDRVVTIDVYPQPIASFSFSPNTPEVGSEVFFEDQSVNANFWEWDFGDGSISNIQHPIHTFNNLSNYNVSLVVSNGNCSDSITNTIIINEELVYYVPNAFTPDGNEHNNTFYPIFTFGYDPFDYHLTIFNRWGEILFESYNSTIGWDGTYNGSMCQDGVYIWKIEFKSLNSSKKYQLIGHVNLLK